MLVYLTLFTCLPDSPGLRGNDVRLTHKNMLTTKTFYFHYDFLFSLLARPCMLTYLTLFTGLHDPLACLPDPPCLPDPERSVETFQLQQ